MNISKRRRTCVVSRDLIQKASMKPLLEDQNLLLPEYRQDDGGKLYELTFKKKTDLDKIPVHVSIFARV